MKTYVTEAIEALKTLLRKEIAAAALAAVPIGTVIYYLGTEIPDGYLLTNGASVSKTDFSDLYDVIGDKFGNVDSTHFNLPNTHHRFLEGTTTLSEVGTYVEAGVPNIKGNSLLAGFVTPSSGEVCGDGPFSGMRRWVQNFTLTSGTNSSVLKFDANLANTLYSDSVTTVRPEAFRALALVRAY